MSFTPQSPPPHDRDDDPDVMHIGGSRGPQVRAVAQWFTATAAVAAALVGFFVWFGATVGWAMTLVGVMLAYMAAMARWAGGDR